ncbi:MAG: aminoacyl-tRNA hydrolase [Candidatus Nealsonbacteria bacterium]|nr:aminoacyl-tRNA hydrolase [Candidatus Nealsonbacteria bacterium]
MVLIVGLGNPGPKYKFTRHNVGFRVIDKLAPLTLKGVVLAKPKSFMNLSGQAVRNLLKNHKLKPDNLIVVHDDIDIPLGKIRINKNRGAGGHKGVQSIVNELKSKNFIRFRIGIQPKFGKPKSPERFVLQKFNKEEGIVKEVIQETVEAIEFSLKEGIEKAMAKFNA